MAETKSEDRLVDFLRSAISDGSAGLSDVPTLVKRVIEENLWQKRYVHQSKEAIRFETFREFVEAAPPEGLGTNLKTLRRLSADAPNVLDLIERMREPLRRGGDRRSKKFRDSKDDNVPFEKPQLGNSRSYALRRLRELRPDLHGKVLANELSVNRAMIAAGFRKKNLSLSKDLEKSARAIKNYFSRPEIDRLVSLLSD